MSNIFFDLQDSVAKRVLGVDAFVGVEGIGVAQERKGDILSQLETLLLRLGVGLTVLTPEISPGGEGPFSLIVNPTVVIVENVIINQSATGTRVAAFDLIGATFGRLLNPPSGWAPDGWTSLLFKGMTIGDPGIKNAVEYDLKFETRTMLQIET